MKIDVEYLEFLWPMKTYLITSGDLSEKINVSAVGFCMPVAGYPPQVAFSIGKKFYTYKLVNETGEFVINIPTDEIYSETNFCGYNSGFEIDKFKETGLTPEPALQVKAPIIKECAVNIECKVIAQVEAKRDEGCHADESITNKVVIIGEVIEAYAEKDVVDADKDINFVKGSFPEEVYGIRFKK